VKVLMVLGQDPGELQLRIHNNLIALGSLRNPNLGVVEATVTMDEGFGLVVAKTQGKLLEELLKGGPLPARAAAEVALEVAWGLAAAHAAVIPDKVRPVAFPHGGISVQNITVTGLAEVVLTNYNIYAARAVGAEASGDVQALAQLMVHLVDGEEMHALPADLDEARAAIQNDLGELRGLNEDLRVLLGDMLDPEDTRRPDIRSVARRLRRIIPELHGLWLSAWAESNIGLPVRKRPVFQMPTPALVMGDPFLDETEEPASPSGAASASASDSQRGSRRDVDETPPLVRVGRRGKARFKVRFAPGMVVALAVVVVLLVAGGFQLARFWLDIHGPMDMADVATDDAGPSKAAAAGPVAPRGDEPDPEAVADGAAVSQGVTVIEAEAGIAAADSEKSDEAGAARELVATDEAIDPEKNDSPLGEGSDAEATDADAADPETAPEASDDGGEQVDGEAVAAEATADAVDVDPVPAVEAVVEAPEVVSEEVLEPVEEKRRPWPRPAGTLGEYDLFVEVPLAEEVELRCTNGLSMAGSSAFRESITQSTRTTCVVSARMRGNRTVRTSVELFQTLDLICRSFGESLRCSERPTGRSVADLFPTDEQLADRLADIRVRTPLARTVDIVCADGARESGIDMEWTEFSKVPIGSCTVDTTMPDGAYRGKFVVTGNVEIICLRDFSGSPDTKGIRPLRCAEATAL